MLRLLHSFDRGSDPYQYFDICHSGVDSGTGGVTIQSGRTGNCANFWYFGDMGSNVLWTTAPTSVTVLGTATGPFNIVTSGTGQNNLLKISINQATAIGITLTAGTWTVDDIVAQINTAVGNPNSAIAIPFAIHDVVTGGIRLTTLNTNISIGTVSEINIESITHSAYSTLGFTVSDTKGTAGTGEQQWVMGCAFMSPSLQNMQIMGVADGGTVQFSCGITSTGGVSVFMAGIDHDHPHGELIQLLPNVSYRPNSWNYLEMKGTIATSGGTVSVRINNGTIGSVTGNTQASPNAAANVACVGIGSNPFQSIYSEGFGTINIDDVYVLDGVDASTGCIAFFPPYWSAALMGVAPNANANNDFLGDIKILSTVPNAVGSHQDWSPFTGSSLTEVNQNTYGDTHYDYCYTEDGGYPAETINNPDLIETFTFNPSISNGAAGGPGYCFGFQMFGMARKIEGDTDNKRTQIQTWIKYNGDVGGDAWDFTIPPGEGVLVPYDFGFETRDTGNAMNRWILNISAHTVPVMPDAFKEVDVSYRRFYTTQDNIPVPFLDFTSDTAGGGPYPVPSTYTFSSLFASEFGIAATTIPT